MKHSMMMLAIMVFTASAAAGELIPLPPDLTAVYALVQRPTKDCNAADAFQKAETLLKDKPSLEKDGLLDKNSTAYDLILQGLECRRCEFPFSLDMKLPPYEQLIPMMKLYRAAARTFAHKGREALDKKEYAEAEQWFSKAVNLGLHIWEEPGITIIQDLITMAILTEGVEGFGDLAIARGDGQRAADCARFLAGKTAYNDQLHIFISQKLRSKDQKTPKINDTFKDIALQYPSVRYLPIKVEILLRTAEIAAFDKDSDAQQVCRKLIESGKNDPDSRIRKIAGWADELSRENADEMLKDFHADLPEAPRDK